LERPHVHVLTADAEAKFWIEGAELVHNTGFSAKELKEIQQLILAHHATIVKEWNEHFSQ
jgi:hypothetical protein